MTSVMKRNQKKNKKTSPVVDKKKFVSESLQKRKPKSALQGKKTRKIKRRGVVYIKHLPHGFYEEQLRGYFSQFGAITRLRLARSTKTLGSKGYAFIEFRYPEVAEIAADAMNNYLMFKNIIKTRFIPPSEVKNDYFRSGVKKVKRDGVKTLTSNHIEARDAIVTKTNMLMTDEGEARRLSILGSKVQKAKKKLAALGIDFDVDMVAQNMGQAVMDASEKAKPKTLENLELESEDEADENFDPSNLDVDSEDEFEDFEYDSEHSDDEDEIDENVDNEKIKTAIKIAKEATKTAKVEPVASTVGKKGKRKQTDEPEVAPVAKAQRKAKENKTAVQAQPAVSKKAAKKPAENKVLSTTEPTKKSNKKKVEPTPADPEILTTKRVAKKVATTVETTKPVSKKEKKALIKPQPEAPVAEKSKKGSKAKKVQAEAEVPEVVETVAKKGKKVQAVETPPKKGRKAKGAPQPASPEPLKKTKAEKKQSPSPVKTKKLAKTSAGIEKQKPVKLNKNLKLAANAVASGEVSDVVTVVKGKQLKLNSKGKKKVGKN